MIPSRPIVFLALAMVLACAAGCRSPKEPVRYKYSRTAVTEKAPEKKKGWFPFFGKSETQDKETRAAATASKRAKVSVPPSSLSGDAAVYRIRKGDQIIIELRSIPREYEVEDIVDENGTVTLDYIGAVEVDGRTTAELERDIRKAYIDQQIYKNITVKVLLPLRSYFVRGEVRNPGRYALVSDLTLVQAIAAAGGYTEFANPKKVKIIRGETTFRKNLKTLEQQPEKDVAVDAGDVIVVPRSFF